MAGRIPEYFIDDLLSRTDLVELIDNRVKLKRAGKNYVACCPFHQEKSPSFTVSPDKQFYYCFGCGASGNAVGFLMDFDRLGFVEALEDLAKINGIEVPREQQDFAQPQDNHSKLYLALDAANQFYQSQLRNPKVRERAISYLKGRGLDGEIAKQFQIGFAPAGWNNLLEKLEQQFDIEILIEAGLVVRNEKDKTYDRFRDRVIFPIRDTRGRTIAFGGRVLGDDKPKYLNSPESPIFHKGRQLYGLYETKQALKKIQRFLVVEGYMDVVALAQHGVPYGVATLGTACSKEHLEKLFQQSNEIVFCFDGDAAGRKAAERALEISLTVMKDGREIKFLFLPEGEDPDTLVRKDGRELFEHHIDNGTPLSDYFFEVISEDINLSSIDGKARLAKNAVAKIDTLPKSIFRQLLVDKLAKMTELSSEALEQAAQAHTQQKPPSPERTHSNSQSQPPSPRPATEGKRIQRTTGTQVTKLVDNVIQMVLHSPQSASEVDVPEPLRSFRAPYAQLLTQIMDLIKERPQITAAGILGSWHATEEGEHLAQLAAKDLLIEQNNNKEALEQAFKRLQFAKVEADLEDLIAAGATDKAKLKDLLEMRKQLSAPTK